MSAAAPVRAADITPLLVTYNSGAVLPWSLEPLRACGSLVVVDNGSTDDSVATVRRSVPQATLVEARANLGFGRANNLGLGRVTTPYALLHNPDARLAPGALDALADAATRYPEAAIIAPVLYDEPDRIADFFRGPFWAPASRPPPEPEGDCCAEFVTGAAMLLNLRLMRDVGFFDPWFFLYFEDDDLCLRVRRAGHPIIVARGATMHHRVRASSRPSARTTLRRHYAMTLSKIYITRKYLGTGRAAALVARTALAGLLSLPLALLTLRRERLLRQAARTAAALLAPLHLARARSFGPAA